MLKKLGLATGVTVAAVAVTALLFGTALAAGPGPKAGQGVEVGGRDIPLAVAAELTGLTEEELLAELEGGVTIPALLEEKGIDLSVFHQAVADARQAAVEEAVAAGTITQGQAAGVRGPHGPGAGAREMLRDGTCDGTGPHGPRQGAGYGEPGEGAGPGGAHRFGAARQ